MSQGGKVTLESWHKTEGIKFARIIIQHTHIYIYKVAEYFINIHISSYVNHTEFDS